MKLVDCFTSWHANKDIPCKVTRKLLIIMQCKNLVAFVAQQLGKDFVLK